MERSVLKSLRKNRHGPFVVPEPYRARLLQAKTAIEHRLDKSSFAIGFCACRHFAGATSLAFDFFEIVAQTGDRKLALVEANLHSPSFESALNLEAKTGFAQYVAGESDLSAVVRSCGGRRPASVITAGVGVPDAPGSLDETRLPAAIQQLRKAFDVMVFDVAPVGLYSDATLLSRHLDGMVLVLEAERDRREVVDIAKQQLEAAGGRVLGAVLNKKPHHIPEWLYRLL